jgi:ATP-dependent exoDNAse (exonuclease V) beta subunit
MSDAAHAERLARDAANRLRALDPRESFLVQAPAGSGKTELLIQRYLALLARVDAPHRVVAMTFTRKAASEMRERVMAALREARDDVPVDSAHQRATRALANEVIAHGEALGWSLLEHPAALSIFTIDALSSALSRQAPITSGLGPAPRVVERAEALYAEAGRATLADADPGDASWRVLLAHLDNNAQQVVDLIAAMLGKREQWLPHVAGKDSEKLRAQVESVLRAEIDAELAAAHAAFDTRTQAALARCAGQAAEYLRADGAKPELARALERCLERNGVPAPHHEDLAAWKELADWLLVARKPFARKTMDKRAGVPSKEVDRGRLKSEVTAMLEALGERPELLEALHRARNLPAARFAESDWATVSALLHVLPQAAAHLTMVFAAHGAVDFAQLTIAALEALGAADAPSDVLLRLDLTIDHLLVDEFQDTSVAQFHLIELITAGWVPGDGRTIFAVGDPMQSIYKFRDAEVRLFLAARVKNFIGTVPVHFIDLARNFRSQGHLVTWTNRVFPRILGQSNEPWRGAVAFAAAAETHPASSDGPPTLEVVASRSEEAARVVAHVQRAVDAGCRDVAILVRARGDLDEILPALRAAGVAFAAVELDALGMRQVVVDLLSLTHAIVQPADRLAALSVLRAPWCGLVLADLFASSKHLERGLAGLFGALPGIEGVSEDGRKRLARVAEVLMPAIAAQGRAGIADRVRGAWLALGGPATIDEAVDFPAVEDFLALLRAHAAGGDIDDWQALQDELAVRFVTSADEATTPVKVMTLFRAKGLEFDAVVIPGLARTPPPDDTRLLRWRTREQGLLLASVGGRGGSPNPVYEYLKWLATTEDEHELGRMLYVGVTRAKRRLHLVGVADVFVDSQSVRTWRTPRSASALGRLWKVLDDEVAPPSEGFAPVQDVVPPAPPLRRLPADFALPALPETLAAPRARAAAVVPAPVFEWAHTDAAAVGTVTHRVLAQMAVNAASVIEASRGAALERRVRIELAAEGVDPGTLDAATRNVLDAIGAVSRDPRGRWLFDPAHEEAVSEWPLAATEDGDVVHVTLDRSFIADGVRWIVDFKTGRHEGGGVEAFLAREVERYRGQLERYARVVRALDARPIRLALYYPLVEGGWREWAFEPAGTQQSLF